MSQQGILNFEMPLVSRVKDYLQEKEHRLALQLSQLALEEVKTHIPSISPPSFFPPLKLQEGVDGFAKKIQERMKWEDVPAKDDWQRLPKGLNLAFWDYFELLEGCGVALFQQVEQMAVDSWHDELFSVVQSVYKDLTQKIKELSLAYDKVDAILAGYQGFCDPTKKWFYLVSNFFKSQKVLDPKLIEHLEKNKKYLSFHFANFKEHFLQYQEMEQVLIKSADHLNEMTVFKGIDPEAKEKYESLVRLLKIVEMNRSVMIMPAERLLRQIQLTCPPERALFVFKSYYRALSQALFQASRSFKLRSSPSFNVNVYLDVVKGIMIECRALASVCALYREALFQADPNPYVRAQSKEGKDAVPVAPYLFQQMVQFGYDLERLDRFLRTAKKHFEEGSLEQDSQLLDEKVDSAEEILHEMGHPLTSLRGMELQAAKLVKCVQQINELVNADPRSIDEVGKILLHSIRLDWKYHVLFSLQDFWDIVEVHQGLIGTSDDRQFLIRAGKLKKTLSSLEMWIQKQEIVLHAQEIEWGFDDLKELTQDFYHTIQRMTQSVQADMLDQIATRQEAIRQLFEVRLIFGKFFLFLRRVEGDTTWIRHQLLFVDQQLDAVERTIEKI